MPVTHVVRYGLSEVFDLSGGFHGLRIAYWCACGWTIEEGVPAGHFVVWNLKRLRFIGMLHQESGAMGEELVRLALARDPDVFADVVRSSITA